MYMYMCVCVCVCVPGRRQAQCRAKTRRGVPRTAGVPRYPSPPAARPCAQIVSCSFRGDYLQRRLLVAEEILSCKFLMLTSLRGSLHLLTPLTSYLTD